MTDTKPQPSARALAVQKRKDEIAGIGSELKKSLPAHIPTDKFVRTVQTALTLNPELAEADKNSVLTSCMKAASDGLVLDGREAALVTFNTKNQKTGKWEKKAQYMPMVAGIIKRVRNSGEISRLNAFVVHENDDFEVCYGLEMTIRHKPNFTNSGKVVGVYAACVFKDGEADFEFMTKDQVEAIRNRSKSGGKGPWVTDWEEMARKTVIRRLAKRLPVDSDMASVVQRIDEDYEFDDKKSSVDLPEDGVTIDHEPEKAKAKKRTGAAAKLNPKADEPTVTDVEPEPVEDDEPPAHVTDGPAEDSANASEDDADVEDII